MPCKPLCIVMGVYFFEGVMVMERFEFPKLGEGSEDRDRLDWDRVNQFSSVGVSMDVVVGKKALTLADVIGFKEGDIVPLDTEYGSPVEFRVNGQLIGYADLMVLDDRVAIRINKIGKS